MKKKILLVDGYNMIAFWRETHQLLKTNQLDAARTILLQKLSHYASFEDLEIICVFDAQYVPGSRQKYDDYALTVVFTEEDETADSYIERMAAELNSPLNRVEVATSDLNEHGPSFPKEPCESLPESWRSGSMWSNQTWTRCLKLLTSTPLA